TLIRAGVFRSDNDWSAWWKKLVELAEIVESDLRAWVRRERAAQQSISQTAIRHAPDLFFDAFQRIDLAAGVREFEVDRVYRGEPANRPRNIDIVEEWFPAMRFQAH